MYQKEKHSPSGNIDAKINMCFKYFKTMYGHNEITPMEFYQVINQTGKIN